MSVFKSRESTSERRGVPRCAGIARIALASSDLDGDMARLKAEGVEFISEPATVIWEDHPSSRFVCFKDPDGTVLELVEWVG